MPRSMTPLIDQFQAAAQGPEGILTFIKSGGIFTDELNKQGWTAGMYAVAFGPAAIEEFVKAGGVFTDRQGEKGYTAAILAAMGDKDTITTFAKYGTFTDQMTNKGYTAEMYAFHSPATYKAYSEAVERQGGLRILHGNPTNRRRLLGRICSRAGARLLKHIC